MGSTGEGRIIMPITIRAVLERMDMAILFRLKTDIGLRAIIKETNTIRISTQVLPTDIGVHHNLLAEMAIGMQVKRWSLTITSAPMDGKTRSTMEVSKRDKMDAVCLVAQIGHHRTTIRIMEIRTAAMSSLVHILDLEEIRDPRFKRIKLPIGYWRT